MSAKTIYIGSAVQLDWTVTPATGSATIPAEVTLKIKPESGSTTTYTSAGITAVAANQYRYIFTPTVAGKHYWQWRSAGAVNHVNEGFFVVEATVLT